MPNPCRCGAGSAIVSGFFCPWRCWVKQTVWDLVRFIEACVNFVKHFTGREIIPLQVGQNCWHLGVYGCQSKICGVGKRPTFSAGIANLKTLVCPSELLIPTQSVSAPVARRVILDHDHCTHLGEPYRSMIYQARKSELIEVNSWVLRPCFPVAPLLPFRTLGLCCAGQWWSVMVSNGSRRQGRVNEKTTPQIFGSISGYSMGHWCESICGWTSYHWLSLRHKSVPSFGCLSTGSPANFDLNPPFNDPRIWFPPHPQQWHLLGSATLGVSRSCEPRPLRCHHHHQSTIIIRHHAIANVLTISH